MRKNLTILLTVILMMVTGATLSYAAFPVSQSTSAAAPAGQPAEAAAQPKESSAHTTAAKMPRRLGHSTSKSQLVAALLCFFLGGLGIHRFYLGYTWQGVVQLLTGGGCGVWALIDFIRILLGTLKPKDGDYGSKL